MSNHTNCSMSPDAIPDLENLFIPLNITFAAIPTSNGSIEAMRTCCEPKPVGIALGCYEWCELTPRYTNGSVPEAEVLSAFGRCISRAGRNRGITGVHMASGTGRLVTTTTRLLFWGPLAMPVVMGLI